MSLDPLLVLPTRVNLSDTFDFQQIEMRGVSLAVDHDDRIRIAAAAEVTTAGSSAAVISSLIAMLGQDRIPGATGDEIAKRLSAGVATNTDGRMLENLAHIGEADLACQVAAQEALTRIGQPAVSALVNALKDQSPNRRIGSAKALGEIGSSASAAVPFSKRWRRQMPVETVRQAASEALKRIKPRRWFSF